MRKSIIAQISAQTDKINTFITRHSILTACVFSLIVSSICLLHSAYLDLDNHMISQIMNQGFGTENYCIFVNYFFCVLVKAINWLIPTADGYILICHSLLYIADAWIAYIIFSHNENIWSRIILLMAVIITLTGFKTIDISNLNFTIQAAGLFSVGAISVFAGIHSKKTTPYLIMAALFFSFGAMLRMAACLLMLPFICLHILTDFICSNDKAAFVRKALVLVVVPMIFVAAIYGTNTAVKKSEKYAPSFAYNSARSNFVDFPTKNWEDVKDELPGMSENDYLSLKRYLLCDTERIDTEYLKKFADISINKSKLSISQLKESFIESIKVFLQIRKYNIPFILLFTVFLLFCNISLWRKLEIICAALGVLIISMWLSYNGRIYVRVCAPMIIMYVIILSSVLLHNSIKFHSKIWRFYYVSLSVVSVILAGVLFGTSIITSNGFSTALLAKTGADESKFEQYWQGDNLYIWDTFTMNNVIFGHYAKQGKLATEKCLKHNIAHGEYIYGQAFTDEYFDSIGTNNPVRALLNRENTYYVTPDITYMETYIREHVNPVARAIEIGEIDDVAVWKFVTE